MQSNQPLVSVVIPCYNHEDFVQDSIQSVIDQTYENIELIIIDDGSKDSSVVKIEEVLESCRKRFVRFEFRSRSNIGLSSTLNEALEWCRGKYYSSNASDDILINDKIATQVCFLEKNDNVVSVFGGVNIIDDDNLVIEKILGKDRHYSFEDILMHRHDLPTPTHMTRLEIVNEIGGYDSDIFIEDWYMWLKLSQKGEVFYMSKIMAMYRQHENNNSKNNEKMHKARLQILELYKNHTLYDKALKNIKWMNACENFVSYESNKASRFLKLILMNPKRLTFRVTRKIYRMVRN